MTAPNNTSLFPYPVAGDGPTTALRACDACRTITRHELSEAGEWVCWCGYCSDAATAADERVLLVVEAAAQLFRNLTAERRARFFGIFVDLLGRELRQELTNALGRMDF